MTWAEHYNKWKNCELCQLCQTRKKIVLARGTVPCQVLLIGEAPGPSENAIGKPFIGPAGKLLDSIIAGAERRAEKTLTKAFTNLIACFPKDAEDGKKFAQPPGYAIKACSPRLMEFVALCRPKLLVLVGQLAAKYLPLDNKNMPDYIAGRVEIVHPAFILRTNDPADQQLQMKRTEIALANAFREIP